MTEVNLIALEPLCTHYNVELSFFTRLSDYGLAEIRVVQESYYISEENISDLEKIIRLYHELDLNLEGIDIVLNLLQKIELQKKEITNLRNRLAIYENDLQ